MATRERYSSMTQDDFDTIMRRLAHDDGTDALLDIPGVWDVVSEYYNNEVLEAWEEDHPEDSDDAWDDDAPKPGDLVFDPNRQGIALQPAYGTVKNWIGREGIQTYTVELEDGDEVSVEFYDSAWHLTDEYLEDQEDTGNE